MGIGRRSGASRAWYPSGPIIGRSVSRSRIGSSQEPLSKKKVPDGNPNPNNWKILRAEEVGKNLVVELQYPDCTNYEGKKILVFEKLNLVNLVNQKLIDPHFFPSGSKYKSPVARFEPTERGWTLAIALAKLVS